MGSSPHPPQVTQDTVPSTVTDSYNTKMVEILGPASRLFFFAAAIYYAYDVRMYAIRRHGTIIHEFDPQFNVHAAEYLQQVGWCTDKR